ncbi:hypothetical protein [Reinekea sp.]|jgi:hypothetical protein|uniref:hypothetical protein n=1 Tax=Reinekea sp. TaxID=1970455 RepID=UPI0039898E8D
MHRTVRAHISGLIFLFISTFTLAEGNLLLVTDLSDENLNFRPDLRLIATNAINRLQDYTVANAKTQVRPNSEEAIAAMLDAAEKAKLNALAVVTLYTPKKRQATVTVSLYSVSTGELIIQRALSFKFKELTALLAQLEYELPLMLKREFRELGSVVKITSDQLYFDLGKNAGVEVGQVFRIFRRGAEIKDRSGESFGFIDDQTGIVEVTEVSSIYAIADIRLGRLSIKANDWVELAGDDVQIRGQVLSKLDEQVAVNIGRKAGVTPGAYFAVYKDIKKIDDEQSFREIIGRIRITEADANSARGEIARSDHYRLAKALIEEGDYIDEVSYLHRNQILFSQTSFGVLGETDSKWSLGLNVESSFSTDMSFRFKGSYGDNWYLSAGLNSAMNHAESFRYGLDIMYGADGFGTYMFTDANLPTPLDKYILFAIEAGYLLGANEDVEGLSVGLNAKIGMGSLF